MENLGTFKIAEPCHENWNQMTPETQGRHCAVCAKCVVDFTNKSKAEMVKIYQEAEGEVCGRVRASQIAPNRLPIRTRLQRLRQGALKSVQMFGLALIAAFALMLHAEVKAQKPQIMGKIAYDPGRNVVHTVYGQVFDESGNPVAGATVEARDESGDYTTTKTDAKGNYRFTKLKSVDFQLIAHHKHEYGQTEIALGHNPNLQLDLHMSEPRVLGEMIYVPDEEVIPIEIDQLEQLQEDVLDPSFDDFTTWDELGTQPSSSSAEELPSQTPPDMNVVRQLEASESLVLADFSLKVFPNPTADKVHLLVENAGSERLNLSLFDIDGKIVYKGAWLRFMENEKTIDVSQLPAGIYLLQLESGEAVLRRQILKF